MIIIGVWILSGLISSPRLFYITTFEVPIPIGPDGEHEEICAPMRTLYNSYAADMIYFVVLFLLPLLVMCVLYTKIARIIWQSSAMLQEPPVITVTDTTRPNREGQEDLSPRHTELAPPVLQSFRVSEEPSRNPRSSHVKAAAKTMSVDLEYGNPANGCEGFERGKVKPPMEGPGAVSRVKDDRNGQAL